jgi:hypothetical protein
LKNEIVVKNDMQEIGITLVLRRQAFIMGVIYSFKIVYIMSQKTKWSTRGVVHLVEGNGGTKKGVDDVGVVVKLLVDHEGEASSLACIIICMHHHLHASSLACIITCF